MAIVASTALYFIAKRRQWNVRASLARASRRLTGRFVPSTSSTSTTTKAGAAKEDRARRRTGVRMVSPTRRNMGVEMAGVGSGGRGRDLEKGVVTEVRGVDAVERRQGQRPREKSWIARLWGNGWK